MTTYSLDRMVVLLSVGLDPPSSTIKRHGMISLTMTSLLSRRETISMASCRNPSAAGRIPELSPKEFGPAVCLPPHLLCCIFIPCLYFAFSFFSHGFLHLCGGLGMGEGGKGEREGPVSMPLPVMRYDLIRCHCFLHLQRRQERV